MISERQLRRLAGRAGIGVGEAEHEYAMLCVLDALRHAPLLSDTFCLKGGTALRLAYFKDWRHSVDLDFSVLPGFPVEALQDHIEAWFAGVEGLHGVAVRPTDLHRANGAARVRAQFIGPLRHPSRLLFDITLDELILLPPVLREVVVSCFVPLRPVVLAYALEEILAEKMRSILQRGKSRDYYDVWRLLKEKAGDLDVGCARAILGEKCRHKGIDEPIVGALLVPQRLEEARAYWERDLVRQVAPRPLPDWDTVTGELVALLTPFFDP
ncbi:MAG: nucleotidyl transferase AbiEii/AbiGii toxin family protein [Anaerolineae bacterium]